MNMKMRNCEFEAVQVTDNLEEFMGNAPEWCLGRVELKEYNGRKYIHVYQPKTHVRQVPGWPFRPSFGAAYPGDWLVRGPEKGIVYIVNQDAMFYHAEAV